MRKHLFIWITILAVVFATSCNRGIDNPLLKEKGQAQTEVLQLLQQIDSLGTVGDFNAQVAKKFIVKADEFSNKYPEDAMSPEFLFKAGLMAMTVAKATENIEEKTAYCQNAFTIFENIERVYPEFSGVKDCMYYKGVIFDDILRDYENAEIYYKMFITRYPTDTLAITLESYLQFLGKSPEEIIATFGN